MFESQKINLQIIKPLKGEVALLRHFNIALNRHIFSYILMDACFYSNVDPTSALTFSLFTFLDVGIQIAVNTGTRVEPALTAI